MAYKHIADNNEHQFWSKKKGTDTTDDMFMSYLNISVSVCVCMKGFKRRNLGFNWACWVINDDDLIENERTVLSFVRDVPGIPVSCAVATDDEVSQV